MTRESLLNRHDIMDLLEYQAKELFRDMGIPVLPSQRINSPKDIKGLTIPYPVVLKSQVYIGGRGRVGGVKFVANTIDAIAAAQTIFNLPIMGEYPQVLLAEAKYNADREFYLAVVLNRSLRRPVLLGSQQGGIDVQSAREQMQHVIVDQEFSAYYARRLALKMGLQGDLIGAVSAILEKMYHLFLQKDLDLLEINPLGVSANGEVMALDGKISINDEAIARHPDLAELLAASRNSPRQFSASPMALDPEGQVSILCNGMGLTLATLDLLCQAGGRPAEVMNVGAATHWDSSATTLCNQLIQSLDLMLSQHPRVLLVNIVSGLLTWDDIAEVVTACLRRHRRAPQPGDAAELPHARSPHLVIRLAMGPQFSVANPTHVPLPDPRIHLVNDLDAAIAKAIALSHVAPVPPG
jgi:succinyl-CoA synthetase beta subunit